MQGFLFNRKSLIWLKPGKYAWLGAWMLLVSCADTDKPATTTEVEPPVAEIAAINYGVVKTYPHDMTAFTEGLLFYNKKLYESTGSPVEMPETKSMIGEINLTTGILEKKIELDRTKYFGEGIVFLKDKLYQLTYTTQIGFVYDARTFKQIGTFTFPNKEGWGLTTDGTHLIMSDGTHSITYFDPETYKIVKTIQVSDDHGVVDNLNELEYVKGFIYANVYTTAYVVKIDTQTGKVVGRMDLSPLQQEAKAKNPKALEMNGIAFDSSTNKFYITGKFWPTIYELNVSM